jgi:tetratricopeptide (TPR) repeat protein
MSIAETPLAAMAPAPTAAETDGYCGALFQSAGDAETAQQQFEAAARQAPEDQQIQKQLADFYYTVQGRTEDALRIYDAVADANPEDVDVHMLAGHLDVALERFDAAEARYREVLRVEPWHADAGRYLDALHRHRAETAPRPAVDPDTLYQEAIRLADDGDAVGAVKALESLVAAHPDHALSYNDLGVLYSRQQDYDRAFTHYQRAVSLEPANTVFQKNLADLYAVAMNRYDEALQIYVALLAKDPHDVEALMGTGHICHLVERSDDAAHFFARVLEVEPWHEAARQCMDALGHQRTAAAG